MTGLRTDMGTFGSAGDLGQPAQAAALTAQTADAPAGGTGATAGAYDTAGNRDTAIALIQNNRARIKEIEDLLENFGIVAKN